MWKRLDWDIKNGSDHGGAHEASWVKSIHDIFFATNSWGEVTVLNPNPDLVVVLEPADHGNDGYIVIFWKEG